MSIHAVWTALASLVLCCLVPQSTAEADGAGRSSCVVHCEIWSAADPALVGRIEALEPTAAAEVLEVLRGAEQGAQRLARVLAPMDLGTKAQFRSSYQQATVSISQGGGASFGGYQKSGTTVQLSCRTASSPGAVKLALDLDTDEFLEEQPTGTRDAVPPDRGGFGIQCEATCAYGELRMLQFQTGRSGTLVVLLRALDS